MAIVGPTGAGKTTLVNLLLRFYDVDSGTITVDGVDIADLTRDDLRRRIGMVLQDTWLCDGTIADNIAYGRPDATREQIVAAATAVHADHLIRTLPDGYDTALTDDERRPLGRGTTADHHRPRVPRRTRHPGARRGDQRGGHPHRDARPAGLAALRQGRTSFVIAHRLSTIRDADLILVMESGRIVEQGTPHRPARRPAAPTPASTPPSSPRARQRDRTVSVAPGRGARTMVTAT